AYNAQTRRYPRVNTAADAVGTWRTCRCRATPAKSRIMGAAEGIIIATIITIHIGTSQSSSGPVGAPGIGIAMLAGMPEDIVRLMWMMYPHDRAARRARPPATTSRSRRKIWSMGPGPAVVLLIRGSYR